MTVWIEIRCDALKAGVDPNDSRQARCHTIRGDNPGMLVGNWNGDYSNPGRALGIKAADDGWHFGRRRKWTCPGCRKRAP